MTTSPNRRTRTKIAGAADYDEPAYWDTKFSSGKDVSEWLNSGEVLMDVALAQLERGPQGDVRPQVLHLGPGISKLGMKLSEAFQRRNWPGNSIVNVDFSAEAVRLGREIESKKDKPQAMHWLQADLRSWRDVSSLSHFAPFDVLLDKSTSDAIATSPSQTLSSSSDDISSLCPTVRKIVEQNGSITLSPVEVLALHLVPLTREGTTWIALSYSTVRFDNLPHLAAHWTVVSRTPLKAPQGQTSSFAYSPDVFHWLYILQRK